MKDISISVETQYLEPQSEPGESQYAFSYTITISNDGADTVQLLSRHWVICDGNEDIEEVHGPGVVGQSPLIPAGESFTYTSGVMLKTPVGQMRGSYDFIDANNQPFAVPIPDFHLAVDAVLH